MMNICSTCGYKVISNKIFEKHKSTHAVQYSPEIPAVDPPVSTDSPTLVESAKPVEVVSVEPVAPTVPDEITIRFMKPVEVTINGKRYEGKEIKVKDMSLASEIVRIAREAYGPTILA